MTVRLGLRANAAQFALLVGLNGLVGAMVGLERSVLPLVGEQEFGLASKSAVLSFLIGFGSAKALANLASGRLTDRLGRKRMLLVGWLLALPVPLLIGTAPSWGFVVVANVFLGASQGFAWSMTVLMKIDLAGPSRRGLAVGFNESAGYLGVAAAAAASGALAASFAPRTVVWVGAAIVAAAGIGVTATLVRETGAHARVEQGGWTDRPRRRTPFAAHQAGFVTNLNDGVAWGLMPLYLAAAGASPAEIGLAAGLYPAVWGAGQVATGALSDRVGRRPLIVAGMSVQAAGLALLVAGGGEVGAALAAAVVLGAGTALAYPTLLAAVSDSAAPRDRPQALAVYRFWRDAGLVAGALVGGFAADALGSEGALLVVAALTAASGVVAAAAPSHPLTSAPRFSQMS